MQSTASSTENLTEIRRLRWEPLLRQAAVRVHLLTLRFAIVVFLLAVIFEYFNFPSVWLGMLIGRLVVVAATAACILLYRIKRMNVYWLITLPFTMMGVLSSYIYAVAPIEYVLPFNCIIFALSLAYGLFAIAKMYHVAVVVCLSMAAIIFFVLQSTNYTFAEWALQGGFLPVISGAFAFLLVQNRVTLQIREITSRLALRESQTLLHAQNKSLEEAKSQLEQSNERLESMVIQRTESLRKSNAERDQMVYRLSHDFKTPMINIRSLIEIIRKEKDPQKIDQIFALMDGSVGRFESLVKSMDQFIHYTREDLQIGQVDLNMLVHKIWATFPQADIAEIALKFENSLPTNLHCDPAKISLALECLMRNAIQFQNTEVSGTLTFSSIIEPDKCIVTVQDNGVGIPPHMLNKVFDLFYRGDMRSQGLGLGLYMVRGTMELMGGSAEIDSNENGTEVRLILPQ